MTNNNKLTLPEFSPPRWIVEVFREEDQRTIGTGSSIRQKLIEQTSFGDLSEAEKFRDYRGGLYKELPTKYVVTLRGATLRDAAEQRLAEIAEALAAVLEATIQAEEGILAYDEGMYGKLDFKTPILGEIESVLEYYPPESHDPRDMGWVGDDGLP